MSADVAAALAEAHRRDWARVLAATARLTRDLDLAEDCTQDAYAQALQSWMQTGVPDRPGAWLMTSARNRARDVLRRESVLRRTPPLLVPDESVGRPEDIVEDDRLRLIFTCCHPALSGDAQVALTLRLVCGLSTAEVARAFLVQESTMAARITRARQKIVAARIPYRVVKTGTPDTSDPWRNAGCRIPPQCQMGGTGLEPVTPSLSRRGRCSHPFTPVRLSRLVTGVALRRTEPVRTRTNARCYHCYH